MRLRTHGKHARRRTRRWALWLFGLGAVALAVATAVTLGRNGQAGATGPDSPEIVARAGEYARYDQSLSLTPEEERTRAAALGQVSSPCCKSHTMAKTCCRCTLSKTVSGLAKHLIVERGYGAAQVRAEVLAWIRSADKDGFPGHACSTRAGCLRPFNQHGCGGMDAPRSS